MLPQLGDGVGGIGDRAVGGVERKGRVVGRGRHHFTQLTDDRGRELVDRTAALAQRCHRRPRPRPDERLGRRERPRVGDGPLDHPRREVVEGVSDDVGTHRAERRGAEPEVAHPEPLHPARVGGGARLVGEVGDRMDGLDTHPEGAHVVGRRHAPPTASRRS